MSINNEELMDRLVRTGMILRHIDGGGSCGRKHGHHRRQDAHGRPGGSDGNPGFHPDGDPDKRCCHGRGPGHDFGHGPGGRKGGHRRGQARVLTAVAMKEGINQKELAFLLGIRPQTLGAMLQKLEEFELIERRKSESDGRAIEVWLTDAGRAHAAEIAEQRALAAADILAALSDDEKEQLSALLDKIDAELEKHRPRSHGHRCEPSDSESE